jgi:DNA-binding HxlR family transcriptional regulator
VEYALTPLGRDLYERVNSLIEWSRSQVGKFEAARARFDAEVAPAR